MINVTPGLIGFIIWLVLFVGMTAVLISEGQWVTSKEHGSKPIDWLTYTILGIWTVLFLIGVGIAGTL